MGLVNKALVPIFLTTVLVILTACSSNNQSRVQIVDQTRNYRTHIKTTTIPQSGKVVQSSIVGVSGNTSSVKGQHVVQQGETLYSLAFNYGRDWRDLAAANSIAAPYIIYPGQTINLSGNVTSKTITTSTHKTGGVKVTTTKETASKPSVNKSITPVQNAPKPTTAIVGGWTWPAIGTVIGTYSLTGNVNKGIDIAASEGTPIVAASAGTVVYAGNNLHGYGNLLIIKHNDSFVSAYGHNRTLLVKEGQKVKAGQKIAEMGSTGTDKVKLHFEIRLNGKPVDPLRYLPKK